MSILCPPTTDDRHALPTFHTQTLSEMMGTVTETEPWIPEGGDVMKPTLVIGDVHGHFDRLERLLIQEGILGPCPDCNGAGILDDGGPPDRDAWVESLRNCATCGGDGQCRINHDVEVVQIGDLGHFGQDASPTGDSMCWQYADKWLDVVLWGNHDRAVVDSHHIFSGYLSPSPEIKHYMYGLYAVDKLKLAHVSHGWLLTHAGLVQHWQQQKGIEFDKNDPDAFADWLNANDWWPSHEDKKIIKKFSGTDEPDHITESERSAMAVRDAISRARGGWSPVGGTLWRDDREEKLYDGMKQIYGHTAARDGAFFYRSDSERDRIRIDPEHKTMQLADNTRGINIDIGSKYGAHLGGVWLPDLRLVRVDL